MFENIRFVINMINVNHEYDLKITIPDAEYSACVIMLAY